MVSRTLWPENQEAIRDEISADCIGLIAAFGRFDPSPALRLLGLKGETYLPGGRLQNYIPEELPDETLLEKVRRQVGRLSALWQERPAEPFDFLRIIEEEKIGLEEFK